MGKIYTNQIVTDAGFSVRGPSPIDDREVVQAYDDLQNLINDNIAYEGMQVYVIAEQRTYELTEDGWKHSLFNKDIEKLISDESKKLQDSIDDLDEKIRGLGSDYGTIIRNINSDIDTIERKNIDFANNIGLLKDNDLKIENQLDTVSKIAKGRNTGYVFQKVENLKEWLTQVEKHSGGFIYYNNRTPYLGSLTNPENSSEPNFKIAIHINIYDYALPYGDWNLPDYTYFYIASDHDFYFLTDGSLNSFTGADQEPKKPEYKDVTLIEHVDLQLGDNLYIVDTGVPDYWYGEKKSSGSELEQLGAFELETQKVDLSEYVTNEDCTDVNQFGLVKLGNVEDSGLGLRSDKSLIIKNATENDIKEKTSKFKPIVPATLDYAVKTGLTAAKNAWSNTEKEAAQSTLGITDELNQVRSGISISMAEAIAKGRNNSYVFNKVSDMDEWLRQGEQLYGGKYLLSYDTHTPCIGSSEDTLLDSNTVIIVVETPESDVKYWVTTHDIWYYWAISTNKFYISDDMNDYVLKEIEEQYNESINSLTKIQPISLQLGDSLYILDENSPNYYLGGFDPETDKPLIYPLNDDALKTLDIRNIEQGKYDFYPNTEETAGKLTTLDLTDVYKKIGDIDTSIQNLNIALEKYGTFGGDVE